MKSEDVIQALSIIENDKDDYTKGYFYMLFGIAVGKRFSGDLDLCRSIIEYKINIQFYDVKKYLIH